MAAAEGAAKAAALKSIYARLREEVTCSICLDYFTDPVLTPCGHNFCRACLAQSWEAQDGNTSCPLCQEPAQQKDLSPNPAVGDIAEISKEFSLPGAKGTLCERHLEPFKFFCWEEKASMCVVCKRSKEHREHTVIPVRDAAEECKEKIQTLLKNKIQALQEQEKAEEQRSQVCLEQLEGKKQEITSALEEMRRNLQEKEHHWLTQLDGLEEEIQRRQEKNMTRLSKEINKFRTVIKDVELQSRKPPSEFLQDCSRGFSCYLKEEMLEKVELCPGLQWVLRRDTPKISVLQKAMQDLKGSLMEAVHKVSVTLDPDTAHPELVLSKDLKSVRCGNINQSLHDNPERFGVTPCVLGSERFTSGRHFWEVEVEKLDGEEIWAVGVALESCRRKELICFYVPKGIWAVGKESNWPHEFLSYTCLGPKLLGLRDEPKKVLVYLDYEEGRVEFFNADTEVLIFTFPPASFVGEGVRPFFMVGSGVGLNC